MPDTLPLIELEAENILRLKAVTIEVPVDGALIVEGRNEQGKSSVLRLADLLLAGARKGEDPIHDNEEEGYVSGKLGPYTITRRFKRGGSPVLTIKEEGKRGRLKAPQTLLAEFVDYLSVDPMKFTRMPTEEQLKVVSRLIGFDATSYDERRKEAYDERTDVNREAKKLEGELAGLHYHPDTPEKELTISEMASELNRRRQHNSTGHEAQHSLSVARKAVKGQEIVIAGLAEQIETLTAKLQKTIDLRTEAEAHKLTLEDHSKSCLAAVASFEPQDEQEILSQMEHAEDTNKNVRENAKRKRVLAEHASLSERSDTLTDTITAIDTEKARARKEAAEKLAIPGLDITDTGIIYNAKPFAQAGMSASIRISAAIAMEAAAEKPVKLLTIDEGQALDDDNLTAVIAQANAKGFQVMMARNGKRDEPGTITIEDGRVAD